MEATRRLLSTPLAVLLVLLSFSSLAWANSEVALRPLPDVLWAKGLQESTPPEVVAALERGVAPALRSILEQHYPKAWKEGQARAQSSRMERELEDLLHLGLRISRLEVQATHFGKDKTVFRLVLTGVLFVANLGSAEILELRTYTWMQDASFPGKLDRLPAEDEARIVGPVLRDLMLELGQEMSAHFRPGVLEAQVAGAYKGKAVLNRGALDGAYVGESFFTDDGCRLDVVAVQDKLSLALCSKAVPTRGARVHRLGHTGKPNSALRVLVQTPPPDTSMTTNVSWGEFGQWLSDQLAQVGFNTLPSGTEFLRAQLAEAAVINVAQDALVGAQAAPDLLVLPHFLRSFAYQTRDEESQADLSLLEFSAACSFVDVRSGAVLFGTQSTKTREDVQQDWGRQYDRDQLLPGLAKDVAIALAQRSREDFAPRRARARIAFNRGGVLTWPLEGQPVGTGAIVEISRRGPVFVDPKSDRELGAVEEVMGTARVTGMDGESESARVLVSTMPVLPGHRIRAVVGTASADGRIVAPGRWSIKGAGAQGGAHLDEALRAALYSSGAFRAALGKEERSILESFRAVLDGGAYALEGEGLPAPEAATHRLDLSVVLDVGVLEESKKSAKRELRADLEATLVDLQSGQAISLRSPKGDAYTTYPMWQKRILNARRKKNEVLVGFSDADMPAQLNALLFDSGIELLRRLRIMADAARGPSQ